MSPVQHSSTEDSNSVRLSICSGVTQPSSLTSSSPNSPNLVTSKEETSNTGTISERERISNTMFTVMEGASTPHRRRRTALLLDQPSKVIGNP